MQQSVKQWCGAATFLCGSGIWLRLSDKPKSLNDQKLQQGMKRLFQLYEWE
jgi:hypothetical protein